MSAKKAEAKQEPSLLGSLAESARAAFPDLARLGTGIGLRALAGREACIEAIARQMVEDEEMRWDDLAPRDRRDWKLRARAALVGLDKYIAAEVAGTKK